MVWNDLAAEERAFFSYFRNKECDICRSGACPIITRQIQDLHMNQPDPYFRPEVFSGNPRNIESSVWFLATNPGLRDVNDALHGCLRTADDCTDEQFRNHNLRWFAAQDVRRYNDPVTKASLVISLAFSNRPLDGNRVNPSNEDMTNHQAELANLCIMNIAHCKSKHWLRCEEDKETVWDYCGKKTLAMLAYWPTKAVVAFGWDPLEWLGHVHGSATPEYLDWQLDEEGLDMVGLINLKRPLPIGRVATLTRDAVGRKGSLRFVSCQRPGPHFTWENVKAVVAALQNLAD